MHHNLPLALYPLILDAVVPLSYLTICDQSKAIALICSQHNTLLYVCTQSLNFKAQVKSQVPSLHHINMLKALLTRD